MVISRTRIERAQQHPIVHLAYPYGDKSAAGTREFAGACGRNQYAQSGWRKNKLSGT